MAWMVPPLPNRNPNAKVDYWLRIMEVPTNEPGADLLRDMALKRLIELRAIPDKKTQETISPDTTQGAHDTN